MGYTHYFSRNTKKLGSAYFYGKLALDAKAIISEAKNSGIVIGDKVGYGSPEFTEAYFSLNGDATVGFDHETFHWEALPVQREWQKEYQKGGSEIFDFCKTAYKPYDAVVTAILIRAKHIYGDCVSIRSDGDWQDWQVGRELYERVFGEVAECPFDKVVA